MKNKFYKNVEWTILFMVFFLLGVGLVALYSATRNTGLNEFHKQIRWILIAIPFFVLFLHIDYNKLAKISVVGYIVFVVLLFAVLFTTPRGGSRSWFDLGGTLFQPAEFAKIASIVFISKYISNLQLKGRDEINRFWKLISVLILIAIPTILIIIEPDYGTALVFIVMFAAILLVAGLRKRYIFFALALGIVLLIPLFTFILPKYAPHALRRFEVFLNPGIDPRGAGYNVIQSKVAVGSGGIFGMGVGNGTQTQLGFLHPKTTDFIFALIAEELGFIFSALVVVIYVSLIVKAFTIAKTAKDNLGSYIATGIGAMFMFHMIQNIGMTMGLLPITGIPLPFVSYGGSSLVSNFIALGILMNISGNRQKAIFTELDISNI